MMLQIGAPDLTEGWHSLSEIRHEMSFSPELPVGDRLFSL